MRIKETRDRIQVLTFGQPAYPDLLQQIKDPPKTLYYIGKVELLRSRCVAVVGSRTTTTYGRNIGRGIALCLARHGVTVVSGMAAGIDTCAHEGALQERGPTIAVLGTGPDICYPTENQALKKAIEQHGLVISEYEPGTRGMRHHFPQRNRIISGLSELTVIVQARNRSGALITAELAAEQGREVYAVPGNIDSQYNLGTNKLIREGVTPLICVEDVLEPLNLKGWKQDGKAADFVRLSAREKQICELLQAHGELTADEVCLRLSLPANYVNPILTSLELKGFLYSASGKFFLANQ